MSLFSPRGFPAVAFLSVAVLAGCGNEPKPAPPKSGLDERKGIAYQHGSSTPFSGAISKKYPSSLEYDFFPKMVGKGICGYETKGESIDIGTPESYSEAEKFFG